MDESPLPPAPPSPSRVPWIVAGALALAALIGVAWWAGHRHARPIEDPGVDGYREAPEVVELPSALAPLAQQVPAILARFNAAAKVEGLEGWPEGSDEVASQLKDPLLSKFFANPRALLLIGPEPGRVDALVLMKQLHPKNPEEPYLPLLVRHLESKPVFHQPWGPGNLAPWGVPMSSNGNELWGWVDGVSLKAHDDGTPDAAFPGLMVARNEPGKLWLAPEGTDGMATWVYGFQDRLALELDDLEGADGKAEHTAEEDIGEGLSTIKRADFDRAKLLAKVWKYAIFEVDGRTYATLLENWDTWKKGPPAVPPTPSSAQEAHP